MQRTGSLAVAAAAAMVMVGSASAATKTLNAASSSWTSSANWTPTGAPDSTNDVLVNGSSGTNMTISNTNLSIQYLTFSGTATRSLLNNNGSTTSTLTLGTPDGSGNLLIVNGGASFTVNGGGSSFLNLVLGASGNFFVDAASAPGSALTVGQAINESGSGRSLTKTGTGTVTLNGAQNYTGGMKINAGMVSMGVNSSFGTNSVQFTGNSILRFASTAPNTLSPTSVTIDSGVTASVNTNAAPNIVFTGAVGGTGGNLSKEGSGILTLSVDSTYTGTTAVVAGTLAIGNGGSTGTLGSGNVSTSVAGAILNFNRGAASGEYVVANTISGSGQVTQINGSTSLTSNANSYAGGTTLNGGRIAANNTSGSATGTGAVTANGGTLGGNGAISGAVTIKTGATLAPGNSAGSLAMGSLALESGAAYNVEIGGTAFTLNATEEYDRTVVASAGSVALGNAALNVDLGSFTPADGDLFGIVQNDSAATISGTFLNLAEGATVLSGAGYDLKITYTGDVSAGSVTGAGMGNDVVLYATAVPEPSAMMAMGLVGLAAIGRRRNGRVVAQEIR